jgi:hypothetical protein
MAMGFRREFFVLVILFFSLVCIVFAEEYPLQYFLTKATSQTEELSQKERTELLSRIEEVLGQAKQIHLKLIQAIRTGETDIRYQEGEFWMSKLGEDLELIESGMKQIRLLREKPTQLVASITLYRSLKDLSSNFNACNNMPSFSALVGDLAPEIELWVDPIFYRLYLLPLAQLKDVEKVPSPGKKPAPKNKKP